MPYTVFPASTTSAGIGFRVFYPFHRLFEVSLQDRSVTLPDGGLDLHPGSDNWFGMAIHTGVTSSALNTEGTTTASLIVREFAGASDAIYTIVTKPWIHNYINNGSGPSYEPGKSFFTFVVTSAPQAIRDLCRRAISQGQESFSLAAEVKITQNSGWEWSSASFAISCYPPIIRDMGF